MEPLVLVARVEQDALRFVARVEGLDVSAEGDSPEKAQEELVQAMLVWISTMDCTGFLAEALAEAGFLEVDDDTQLQMEFAE